MIIGFADAAHSLDALRSPPGNRLEALKADRAGQFSIRVNDRWRVLPLVAGIRVQRPPPSI